MAPCMLEYFTCCVVQLQEAGLPPRPSQAAAQRGRRQLPATPLRPRTPHARPAASVLPRPQKSSPRAHTDHLALRWSQLHESAPFALHMRVARVRAMVRARPSGESAEQVRVPRWQPRQQRDWADETHRFDAS